MATRKLSALEFLDRLIGAPVTLGKYLEAIRLGEEMSQPAFARQLGISRSHLNDIEKGRKAVSPERAARFARLLGYSEIGMVQMALQDLVDADGLKLRVRVHPVDPPKAPRAPRPARAARAAGSARAA
jgi:transcriptional regulator with XRE-family HTH domain